MVDILQVLEGATYMAFIVGAIVAVYELRDIKKERRLETTLRIEELSNSREFHEAAYKISRSKETTAEGLEKDASYVNLTMMANYFETLAELAANGLADKKVIVDSAQWGFAWKKMSPWISAMRKETGDPEMFCDFEKLALMQLSRAEK